MLFLVFTLGQDRYALEATQVKEVLPLIDIRPLPQAPAGIAGVFDFRGQPVPVIDLSELVLGRRAEQCLSTRLIIVGYPDSTGERRSLGLIAEKATTTVARDPRDFVDAGIAHGQGLSLGPVASEAEGFLQWVDVRQLLPMSVRSVLFVQREKGSWSSPGSKAC